MIRLNPLRKYNLILIDKSLKDIDSIKDKMKQKYLNYISFKHSSKHKQLNIYIYIYI